MQKLIWYLLPYERVTRNATLLLS